MNTLHSNIIKSGIADQVQGRAHILMVTHVIPYPPAAGNEIRIYNLLSWFHKRGYFVSLVLKPLDNIEISNECVLGLVDIVDDLHIYDSRVTIPAGLEGEEYSLDDDLPGTEINGIQDTFCPEWFARDVSRIISEHQPHVIISQYVFMSRILNTEESAESLKIIDSHDLFSNKQETLDQYGIKDYGLSLTTAQEQSLLGRADIILAIQQVEKNEIMRLVPDKRVLLTSFDLDIHSYDDGSAVTGRVLIVASGNEFNVKGTQDFIDYTWPLVRENNFTANLHIVGRVCEFVQSDDPSIQLLGFVESLDFEYEQAEIVVNPCRVGTGLKIKTIEALSRGKAHVAWPSSIDGLREIGDVPVKIVNNVVDFSDVISELLRYKNKRKALGSAAHQFIRDNFTAERVYSDLDMEIESFYLKKK